MEMDTPPEPLEWLVDVPLTVGMPLGISVMQSTGVVTAVQAAGTVPEMNARNPELAIQPGDRITAVNDEEAGGAAGDAVQLLRDGLSGASRRADGTLKE